ncbi:MAG TPA: hypothetical protein VM531_11345 [Sphingomicrobium sp.]|jgi:hypothetical protein|nr:hypothetical protein [Sphingomicrobium sp.]
MTDGRGELPSLQDYPYRSIVANLEYCPECKTMTKYEEVKIKHGVRRSDYRCDACGWRPSVSIAIEFLDFNEPGEG